MGLITKLFGTRSQREIKKIQPTVDKILGLEKEYAALSEEALKGKTAEFKERIAQGEDLDDLLPEAFAAIREAAWRVLGMKPYPVQLIGGIVLHQGRIAEMKTGEGKTLVAILPCYLNALTGQGVHVVTVNEYLAKRDSEWMGKVYRYMGLSVGLIIPGMTPAERRVSYAADITYCTNNELGFDYLRDNMAIYKQELVQRGHAFAIVDEVDSILIDEARTPLIISGKGEESSKLYEMADYFVSTLRRKVFAKTDEKEVQDDYDCDYFVDEKARTVSLTAEGIAKAEKYFGVENLADAENTTLSHHLNQAMKARGLMKRDIDYVVKDGQIIIVDEFTGRLMYGRRYNEGLHQAIEAKEGVTVAGESKTLATITFQNFFRLYDKLSGMTGTALTEETEFREIYNLDVVEVPTNKPLARVDLPDVVYKTEKAKFAAVIDKIIECHAKGQPVLVGTISIEKSELLGSLLGRRGIKHEVLNAKFHEKEAEIIAQAGKPGAVTIATNMAGRGTDIMLGGNSEFLAKAEMRKQGFSEELISEATGFGETDDADILNARTVFSQLNRKYKEQIAPEADRVREAGGLCILGTERHESRRVDNQLRGRAGRQGDPGETRFYLSMEDDLMRLFGGERVYNMMDKLGVDENQPLELGLLSSSIENAQSKVEYRNFSSRKNVLEYDDVMNKQRELIYAQRNSVLDGDDIHESVRKMIDGTIDDQLAVFAHGDDPEAWNLDGLRDCFRGWLTGDDDFKYSPAQLEELDRKDLKKLLSERAEKLYAEREAKFGAALMRELERVVLLRTVDINWMDHIDAMDELRRGIHLRAYGQHNPVVEYRNEGYDMFNAMTDVIRHDTAKLVLTVQVKSNDEVKREQVAKPTGEGAPNEKSAAGNNRGFSKNGLCPCGSGKKYKRCCGKDK